MIPNDYAFALLGAHGTDERGSRPSELTGRINPSSGAADSEKNIQRFKGQVSVDLTKAIYIYIYIVVELLLLS